MNAQEIRRAIERDGYALVPGLIPQKRIERFNALLARFFATGGRAYNLGKSQPNAAMYCPELHELIAAPEVVAAFRAAIGQDDIAFTGHCDIHQDMISGWHKDTGPANGYFGTDCFVDGCNVIKMGIYLQDHEGDDGLTVVPGSHRDPSLAHAGAKSLHTRAGDVVLFDVRITHRGRSADGFERQLLKLSRLGKKTKEVMGAGKPGEPAAIVAIENAYTRMRGISGRRSIFFTYGPPDRFTSDFSRNNMERQQAQLGEAGRSFDPRLRSALSDQQVLLYPDDINQRADAV